MKILITIPKQKFEVYPKDLDGLFNHKEATKACEALGEDWRLPTVKEFLEMHDYKKELRLKDINYWSSTEYGTTSAFSFDLDYGIASTYSKNGTDSVRAVRTIKY